ncbi:MAG: hypothetical protein U1E15_01805 [Hyphomicrobiales bacterium]
MTDARHIDRCLSCLACMTTCPSGVLHASGGLGRAHVEKTFQAAAGGLLRNLLAFVMPLSPVPLSHGGSGHGKTPDPTFPACRCNAIVRRIGTVARNAAREDLGQPERFIRQQRRAEARVALLRGCVQSVIDPGINAATIRLLNRLGFDVRVAAGGCCGS